MKITHQKASSILRKLGTDVKSFKRHTFCGYSEICLPKGGKIKHHNDHGYWLTSYSTGDCDV